ERDILAADHVVGALGGDRAAGGNRRVAGAVLDRAIKQNTAIGRDAHAAIAIAGVVADEVDADAAVGLDAVGVDVFLIDPILGLGVVGGGSVPGGILPLLDDFCIGRGFERFGGGA